MQPALGQTAKKKKGAYAEFPLWIEMMEDTLTNYFEAQKAFETYWKSRPLPVEEEDIIGHTAWKAEDRKSWLQKIFTTKKERKEQESELLAFQFKKFKNWERAMQPYVQDDGSILTPTQRIAIWREHHSKK